MPATERIRDIIQRWFLAEPLLFAAWTTHELIPQHQIKSIRIGRGKVEFNPAFIDNLTDEILAEVMRFEAVRIILKHPYERKKQHVEAAWQASNITIQECLQCPIPMPRARDAFGTEEYDQKFYEFYYGLILERQSKESEESDSDENEEEQEGQDSDNSRDNDSSDEKLDCEGDDSDCETNQPQPTTDPYFEPTEVAAENTEVWDQDHMLSDKIDDVIAEIQATQNWGTLAGQAQELIEATLKPRLDYRRVLHAFRASVISMRRRLTRVKPSRRYGFQFMGSKREFSTRLLFGIDVSGSVSSEDVTRAFSIVNRFFKYGIEQVDVIWFDSEIRSEEPLQLKKAARRVKVHGRGGTKFQPVIDYLGDHREYEGLIVFTDGIAPAPKRTGKNRYARVFWLFNTEDNWKRIHKNLEGPGMWSAFVEAD